MDLIPLFLSTLQDLFDNYHLKAFIISATLRNQETLNAFLSACGTSCPLHCYSRIYALLVTSANVSCFQRHLTY